MSKPNSQLPFWLFVLSAILMAYVALLSVENDREDSKTRTRVEAVK